jgi:hypothetical protein
MSPSQRSVDRACVEKFHSLWCSSASRSLAGVLMLLLQHKMEQGCWDLSCIYPTLVSLEGDCNPVIHRMGTMLFGLLEALVLLECRYY